MNPQRLPSTRSYLDRIRLPTKSELHADLTLLFAGFTPQDRGDPTHVIGAYMIAVSGYPAEAIHDGIVSLISGKAPEHEGATWLPSSAIVGRVVMRQPASLMRAKDEEWRRKLAHWQAKREWHGVWGPGPDDNAFPHVCPEHLHADFGVKRIAS